MLYKVRTFVLRKIKIIRMDAMFNLKPIEMETLTSQINFHFLIRLSGSTHRLVSVSTLSELFGLHFAEKWCKKALSSTSINPTFRKNGVIITFVWR